MLHSHLPAWNSGKLMAFSGIDGVTDYLNGLTMRTSFDFDGIEIKLPGEGKIEFYLQKEDNDFLSGDCFSLGGGALKGAFVDAHHFLIAGDCNVELDAEKLLCVEGEGRKLIAVKDCLNEALIDTDIDGEIKKRLAWIDGAYIPDKGDSTALALALSQMKTQVYSPCGSIKQLWTTPDRWPHQKMWLWDSAFHAIGYRHLSLDLAKDALDSVLDSQREDGFIPLCAPDFTRELTQPPVLALAYKLVNDMADDKSWISKAYPKLKGYIEWDLNNRDSDGAGLVEWAIEGDENCRSGESGMDNSPRFDSATQLDAVDFNAMLALECEIMAEFAMLLGNGEEEFWRKKHSCLCALINERLWNEKEGFYFDYDVEKGAMSAVMANSGFLPLICGAASPKQAEKLAGHLRNPETFGAPLPVPTIAAKSTEFYKKDMWRGPVWINVNWLIAYGFKRYGMDDAADYIVSESMKELERFCGKYGSFFEFFDDRKELDPPMLMRKGKNAPEISPYHQAFFDFGWSATLYVDMAFM